MVQLARENGKSPIMAKDLADGQEVSAAYVDQILIPLRAAGLVISHRGRNGGYQLARPADQITALEVVESIDGQVCLVECVADEDLCDRAYRCVTRDIWSELTDNMRNILKRHTLAELGACETKLLQTA
jgi:Rrf2 family protein